MFPIAVASEGPAITGIPMALAVHWFRRSLRLPPPITWRTSIGLERVVAGFPILAGNVMQGFRIYSEPVVRVFQWLVDYGLCNIFYGFFHVCRIVKDFIVRTN